MNLKYLSNCTRSQLNKDPAPLTSLPLSIQGRLQSCTPAQNKSPCQKKYHFFQQQRCTPEHQRLALCTGGLESGIAATEIPHQPRARLNPQALQDICSMAAQADNGSASLPSLPDSADTGLSCESVTVSRVKPGLPTPAPLGRWKRSAGACNTESMLLHALTPPTAAVPPNPHAFSVSKHAPAHVKKFMAAVVQETSQPGSPTAAQQLAPDAKKKPRRRKPLPTTYSMSFQGLQGKAPAKSDAVLPAGTQSVPSTTIAQGAASARRQVASAVGGSPIKLQKCLKALDGDGDGALTYSQLLHSLRGLGVHLSTRELGGMLTELDPQGLGVVDAAHATACICPPQSLSAWQPLQRMREITWRAGADTAQLRRLLHEAGPPGSSDVTTTTLATALARAGAPMATSDVQSVLKSLGARGDETVSQHALLAALEEADGQLDSTARPGPTTGLQAPDPAASAGQASDSGGKDRPAPRGALVKTVADSVLAPQVIPATSLPREAAHLPAHHRRLRRVFQIGSSVACPGTPGAPPGSLAHDQLRFGLSRIGVHFTDGDFSRFVQAADPQGQGFVSYDGMCDLLGVSERPQAPREAAPPSLPFRPGPQPAGPVTRGDAKWHKTRPRSSEQTFHPLMRYETPGLVNVSPPHAQRPGKCKPDPTTAALRRKGLTVPDDDLAGAVRPDRHHVRRHAPEVSKGHMEGQPRRRARRGVPQPATDHIERLGILPSSRAASPAEQRVEGDRGWGLRGFTTQAGTLTADAQASRKAMAHSSLWGGAAPPRAKTRSQSAPRLSVGDFARGASARGSFDLAPSDLSSRQVRPPPPSRKVGHKEQASLGQDLVPLGTARTTRDAGQETVQPASISTYRPNAARQRGEFASSGKGSWQARAATALRDWRARAAYAQAHFVSSVDMIGQEQTALHWAQANNQRGEQLAPAAQRTPDAAHSIGGEKVCRPVQRPPPPPLAAGCSADTPSLPESE